MYYFDHAASTPTLECALAAFLRAPKGNPDSAHAAGRAAKKSLEESREIVAACIGAEPEEIYFCSGGTEANNLAVQALQKYGTIVRGSTSHASVWETVGREKTYQQFPCLSAPYVNNETGEILSPEYIAAARANYDLLHLDGVAAVGQTYVDVQRLDCDCLTAAGHKFGAPQGIGFIYARRHTLRLSPLFVGGGQEGGVRPGTPSVALASAMAAALAYRTENMYQALRHMSAIRQTIEDLVPSISGGHINAKDYGWTTSPHIISIRFDGIPSAQLLPLLDAQGVCCSAGSACSAGSREPSRVLIASGLSEKEALETVRISICPETTQHDAEILLSALKNAVEKLRKLLPRAR